MPLIPALDPSGLHQILLRLASGAHLTAEEAQSLFSAMITGMLPDAVVGGVLLAMRARGESAQEIAGAVSALRQVMHKVDHPTPNALVDTCGTGGGSYTTINISTAAAFVAAGAGVAVAKHGNRSFTSRSGSADVLEAMGVDVGVPAEQAASLLRELGLVFLFAPNYHPAMRHVAPVRRALGVPTIMNLIGPLANPAMVRRQVVGVPDSDRAPLVAGALAELGALHAWVVRGEVGMDEISPVGLSRIWEVRHGEVSEWLLDPAAIGVRVASLEGLEGGEPAENGARILALFEAPANAPPALEAAVVLNAAAALVVAGAATDFRAGVDLARQSLYQRLALDRLERLRAVRPLLNICG